MKNYIDLNTQLMLSVPADGSQDYLIGAGMIQITEDQVKARVQAKLDEQVAAFDYAAKRRAEYPALGDQFDALWKGGDFTIEMQARIMAIKAKYPKPVI